MVVLPDKGKLIETRDREHIAVDEIRARRKAISDEIRRQSDICGDRQRRGESTILQERRIEVLRARLASAFKEFVEHGMALYDAEHELRRHWKRERRIEREKNKY